MSDENPGRRPPARIDGRAESSDRDPNRDTRFEQVTVREFLLGAAFCMFIFVMMGPAMSLVVRMLVPFLVNVLHIGD